VWHSQHLARIRNKDKEWERESEAKRLNVGEVEGEKEQVHHKAWSMLCLLQIERWQRTLEVLHRCLYYFTYSHIGDLIQIHMLCHLSNTFKLMSWGRARFGLYTSNLATATQLLISELFYHTVQEAYIHKTETIDTAKTIAQRQKYRNIIYVTGVQIRYRNRNKMYSIIMHNVIHDQYRVRAITLMHIGHTY